MSHPTHSEGVLEALGGRSQRSGMFKTEAIAEIMETKPFLITIKESPRVLTEDMPHVILRDVDNITF
jgi:hypothetical protein